MYISFSAEDTYQTTRTNQIKLKWLYLHRANKRQTCFENVQNVDLIKCGIKISFKTVIKPNIKNKEIINDNATE